MSLMFRLSGDTQMLPGQIPEHSFDEHGGVVGRSDECHWQLLCPARLISRRHAVVTAEAGRYYLYDASSNGVFLNDANEPLGPGNRALLSDGDSLRMGNFVIRVTLDDHSPGEREPATHPEPEQDAPADSAVPESVQGDVPRPAESAPPSTNGTSGSGGDVASVSGAGGDARVIPRLGHPDDVFQPPATIIPEDWDFKVDGVAQHPDTGPGRAVSRQLDALEPASRRAIIEALALDPHALDENDLSPEALAALAGTLRICLRGLFSLRAEYESAERIFSPDKGEQAVARSIRFSGAQNANEFLELLLHEARSGDTGPVLDELRADVRQMQGIHYGTITTLWKSFSAVINVFSPAEVEAATRRAAPAKGIGKLVFRLRMLLFPAITCWRFYRAWFDTRRNTANSTARDMFGRALERFMANRSTKGARSQFESEETQ